MTTPNTDTPDLVWLLNRETGLSWEVERDLARYLISRDIDTYELGSAPAAPVADPAKTAK
jgi:hypothetical protein